MRKTDKKQSPIDCQRETLQMISPLLAGMRLHIRKAETVSKNRSMYTQEDE